MTKKEFIVALSEKSGLSNKDTVTFVNAFIDTITEELSKGNNVNIQGFGCFDVRERKEKLCQIPMTTEKVVVPSTKAPVFKAGKTLKAKLAK